MNTLHATYERPARSASTSRRVSWRSGPTAAALVVLAATTAVPLHAQDAAPGADAARQTPPAHVHILHTATSFRGTPDRMGLLPTAIAEADVARQHAELAARAPADLESMQRHAGHVIHALDPTEVENGPGLGYGMIRAAERTAHYVELAMASSGGGDAIQTHGPHVATAARSAMAMAEEAVAVAEDIVDADTAEEAAELLARLTELTAALRDGVDADGDGRISWQEGEGGLAQAEQHLGLLMRGEGLGG